LEAALATSTITITTSRNCFLSLHRKQKKSECSSDAALLISIRKGVYMNYQRYVLSLFRLGGLLLFVVGAISIASAQYPPAVGPAPYKNPALSVSVSGFPGVAAQKIQKILKDTNQGFKDKGKSYSVSLAGDPTFTSVPYRLATENENAPNQYYVTVPMSFTVNVNIPNVADRQLVYPLNINLTCDGWYTGNGTVVVNAVPGTPSLEGGSILEDIAMIRDAIDERVRDNIPSFGSLMVDLPLANKQCVTIGASSTNGTPADIKNAYIAWDAPPPKITIVSGGPHLVITYLSLKRLIVPSQANNAAVETFQLDTYANFDRSRSPTLAMRVGDVVTLKMAPVIIGPPLPNILVVIANIDQSVVDVNATRFRADLKSANFSPGEHTLQIPTKYLIPGSQGHPKPTYGHTPGYELTYKVDFVSDATIGQPRKAH
jgi:hypothetical protein